VVRHVENEYVPTSAHNVELQLPSYLGRRNEDAVSAWRLPHGVAPVLISLRHAAWVVSKSATEPGPSEATDGQRVDTARLTDGRGGGGHGNGHGDPSDAAANMCSC
jgi:hypothetical protein